ncbi:MAG: GSCFA domain-containing protein, partial [Bacteroidota bacterium]
MSNFRTVITKQSPSFFIQHPDPIFCMGSCFAQHIGQRLMRLKFSVDLNPFGILYNPVSIGKALQMLIQGQPYPPEALFEHQGLWHSFDHHSQFSHPNKSQALENINQGFHQASQNIAQSHYLLLTLGTAHVFTHHATSRIVANCHKLPADQFSRRRLRVEEIVSALSAHLQSLQQRSPHLKVILSVSPIRHWRDGAVENQRSKAALILAIAQLCEELPFVHYYPA